MPLICSKSKCSSLDEIQFPMLFMSSKLKLVELIRRPTRAGGPTHGRPFVILGARGFSGRTFPGTENSMWRGSQSKIKWWVAIIKMKHINEVLCGEKQNSKRFYFH